MRRAWRLGLITLGALLAGYVLVCAILLGAQRQIMFPAPEGVYVANDGSRRVEVPNGTFFLWRSASQPGGPVVVHFHSNGDQVGFLSWMGQEWAREGASFAAVEYPGYPGAGGEPSEESILAAAEAALVHLTGVMKIDRARIVLVGQSLGTGVAVTMAARGWGTRLVLISAYTSWAAVAAHAFPGLPAQLLMRDRFDSLAEAPRVRIPTLVVHGTRDTVVPFEQGETVSAQIKDSQFLAVKGGHHHDVLEWGDTQASIIRFVLGPR